MLVDQNFYTCGVNMEINLKIINETHKRFHLCHFNVRSSNKLKFDYFNYLLHFLVFDVVCITDDVNNKFCKFSGYNVRHDDRTYTERGDGNAF